MNRYYVITCVICLMALWKQNILITMIGLILLILFYAIYNNKQKELYISNASPNEIYDKRYRDIYYSILEFKAYSPINFNDSVMSTLKMLQIFNEIKQDTDNCVKKYQILEENCENAINYLHSIIYSIYDNKLIKKLMIAINMIKKLNCEYINETISICQNLMNKNGYNKNSDLIPDKIKGYNFYYSELNDNFKFY